MLDLAMDSWNYLFTDSTRHEYHSVAAVVPFPNNETLPNEPTLNQTKPTMADNQLGSLITLNMEQKNGRIIAKPQNWSMARIYRLGDDLGSPRSC